MCITTRAVSYILFHRNNTVAIAGIHSLWFLLNNDIYLNQIKYIKQILHVSHLIFTFQRIIEIALHKKCPPYSITSGHHFPIILLICYNICLVCEEDD